MFSSRGPAIDLGYWSVVSSPFGPPIVTSVVVASDGTMTIDGSALYGLVDLPITRTGAKTYTRLEIIAAGGTITDTQVVFPRVEFLSELSDDTVVGVRTQAGVGSHVVSLPNPVALMTALPGCKWLWFADNRHETGGVVDSLGAVVGPDLEQATPAQRPTYVASQLTGYGGAHGGLLFSGAQMMQTVSNVDMSADSSCTVLDVHKDTNTGLNVYFEQSISVVSNPGFVLYSNDQGSGSTWGAVLGSTTTAGKFVAKKYTDDMTAFAVRTWAFDTTYPTNAQVEVRKAGVSQNTIFQTTRYQATGMLGNAKIYIGARGGLVYPMSGTMCLGAVYSPKLSQSDERVLNRAVARYTGLTMTTSVPINVLSYCPIDGGLQVTGIGFSTMTALTITGTGAQSLAPGDITGAGGTISDTSIVVPDTLIDVLDLGVDSVVSVVTPEGTASAYACFPEGMYAWLVQDTDDILVKASQPSIVNAYFEDGTTGWTPAGTSVLTSVAGYIGLALQITAVGSTPLAYQAIVGIVAANRYGVDAYAAGDGTYGPRMYLGSGNIIWTGTSSTSWQHLSMTANATNNYTYIGSSTDGGTARWDQLAIDGRSRTRFNAQIGGALELRVYASQGTASYQPWWDSSTNSLRFDQDQMGSAALGIAPPNHIFVVGKGKAAANGTLVDGSSTNYMHLYFWNTGTTVRIYALGTPIDVACDPSVEAVYDAVFAGATVNGSKLGINGGAQTVGTLGAASGNGITFSETVTAGAEINLKAVVVLPQEATGALRAKYVNKLKSKYGIA